MKILTLAAGLGTRVSGISDLPKPLIEVSGRTILEWSLRSFHRCQVAGIVGASDYIVAVQKAHEEKHQIADLLSGFDGKKASLIQIDGATAGPAETAFQALSSAIDDGIVSPDEPIIINDCDHFFDSGSVYRGVKELATGDEKTLMLFEANKNPDDYSWSFVERLDGVVIGLKEKPSSREVENINLGLGLAGVYGWSSVGEYLDLYSEAFLSRSSSLDEHFISAVADFAIRSGWRAMIGSIRDFVPLGSEEQVEFAESNQLLAPGFQEPGTLFIDIDGTLVEHDSGYFSPVGRYSSHLKPLDSDVLETLNELAAQGMSIVLISSRPPSQEEFLRANFSRLGIKFDRLILGLSGGPRYLINDTKPKLIGFPTAVAMNVERNKPDFLGVRFVVEQNEKMRVGEDFGGESGADTKQLLLDQQQSIVRKTSIDSRESRELMAYQASWYQHIGNLDPKIVPRVCRTNFDEGNSRWSFDTEYMPGITPAYKFVRSQSRKLICQFSGSLMDSLDRIYAAHVVENSTNAEVLLEILSKKSLLGYKKALRALLENFSLDSPEFIDSYGRVPDITPVLEGLSTGKLGRLSAILKMYESPATLIHGDPTLGNLQVSEARAPVLLDPVGARIEPNFISRFGLLGRTLPLFDWARVELSCLHNYDDWNESLTLEGTKLIESQVDSSLAILRDELSSFWDVWAPNEPSVRALAMLTTVTRVMPYKALAGKFKEVIALMRLATHYSEELL